MQNESGNLPESGMMKNQFTLLYDNRREIKCRVQSAGAERQAGVWHAVAAVLLNSRICRNYILVGEIL